MEDIGYFVLYSPGQSSGEGFEQVPLVPLHPTPLQHLFDADQGSFPQLPCLAVQCTYSVLP